eukprot:GHRQ01025550.1.p3 GENE.GHRQ01025550.1~~GHRQ01025550.1.p3  ORF type:complete len:113 (+),score=42.56 GHRQ01025550.1:1228-1566(+)
MLTLRQRHVCKPQVQQHPPVALTAEQAGIPGLQLHPEFVTPEQEAALLQHLEQQPWQQLAKRRVQHYGYCFDYSQRGVDAQQRLGPLPEWAQPLIQRMEVGDALEFTHEFTV